jgi:hypothetical protein
MTRIICDKPRRQIVFLLFFFSAIFSIFENRTLMANSNPPNPLTDPFFLNLTYFFAAGSSLHSADYTMRQDYQPGACIAAMDTGAQFFTLNLNLPQGSRIDYLRLYYYDTDAANNSEANIRKYDAAGNYTEITSVSSSGSGGYGSALSGFANHVVDNGSGAYVLNWQPIVTGSTMQLCGLRVAYRLPAKLVYLPLIIKN